MTAQMLALVLASALTHHRKPPPDTSEQTAKAPLSEAEVRSRVNTYLGSIDTPISAKEWQALGPQAASILKEIALNPQSLPSRRAKAVSALGAVGGPTDGETVSTVAQSSHEPFVVRLAALRATEKLVPAQQLLPALRPILEGAKDQRLRKAAADALTRGDPQGSCAAVAAQAKREDELGRKQFAPSLARCER